MQCIRWQFICYKLSLNTESLSKNCATSLKDYTEKIAMVITTTFFMIVKEIYVKYISKFYITIIIIVDICLSIQFSTSSYDK